MAQEHFINIAQQAIDNVCNDSSCTREDNLKSLIELKNDIEITIKELQDRLIIIY